MDREVVEDPPVKKAIYRGPGLSLYYFETATEVDLVIDYVEGNVVLSPVEALKLANALVLWSRQQLEREERK
jgi:hypothetical protein